MVSRAEKLAAGKLPVDVALVRRLIAEQFPRWANLPIHPVETDGWDNWTFHLGDRMKVRLPSAAGYVEQAHKESFWLPRLAPHLPVAVPVPLALGEPTAVFPYPWSIYDWIEGDPVTAAIDKLAFARDMASFLNALQAIDPTGGPPPGEHNFLRGAHPIDAYGAEARELIGGLGAALDAATAHAVLDAAAGSRRGTPVWLHGDVAVGNALVRDGRLSAVIDFGGTAVGDPACDLVLAWTFFEGDSRDAFVSLVAVDDATWARARAWALWKAVRLVTYHQTVHPAERPAGEVIAAVLGDFSRVR